MIPFNNLLAISGQAQIVFNLDMMESMGMEVMEPDQLQQ